MMKTEFEEIICLPNRSGSNIILQHVDDCMYKLFMDNCEYYTPHYNDKNELIAVDPDGGPVISAGLQIKTKKASYTITNIYWDDVCNCFLIDITKTN